MVSCAHETPHFDSNENLFSHINKLAIQEDAVVVLKSSTIYPASNLILRSDSAYWVDPRIGNRKSISTAEIVQVEFVNHGSGIITGCAAGLFIGGMAGYLITLISTESSSKEAGYAEGIEGLGISIIALGGGVLGATSGGIGGQIDIYPINSETRNK